MGAAGRPNFFSEIPALPASFRCRQRPDERIRHRVIPSPMARNSVCNIFYQNVSIFAGDCPAEIFDFPNAGALKFCLRMVWIPYRQKSGDTPKSDPLRPGAHLYRGFHPFASILAFNENAHFGGKCPRGFACQDPKPPHN